MIGLIGEAASRVCGKLCKVDKISSGNLLLEVFLLCLKLFLSNQHVSGFYKMNSRFVLFMHREKSFQIHCCDQKLNNFDCVTKNQNRIEVCFLIYLFFSLSCHRFDV